MEVHGLHMHTHAIQKLIMHYPESMYLAVFQYSVASEQCIRMLIVCNSMP